MKFGLDTIYKGYRFRSRTEARWAIFFDAFGIKWEYEKEDFDIPSGRYLPDFWLPKYDDGIGVFAEIKGDIFSNEEIDKCKELCEKTKKRVLMLSGTPDFLSYSSFTYNRTSVCGVCEKKCDSHSINAGLLDMVKNLITDYLAFDNPNKPKFLECLSIYKTLPLRVLNGKKIEILVRNKEDIEDFMPFKEDLINRLYQVIDISNLDIIATEMRNSCIEHNVAEWLDGCNGKYNVKYNRCQYAVIEEHGFFRPIFFYTGLFDEPQDLGQKFFDSFYPDYVRAVYKSRSARFEFNDKINA